MRLKPNQNSNKRSYENVDSLAAIYIACDIDSTTTAICIAVAVLARGCDQKQMRRSAGALNG